MKRALVRSFIYIYFSAGVIGLLQGWLMAPFVLVLTLVLLGANWENLGRPISMRRWIPLFLVATVGIARVIFVGPASGAGLLS
jgi:hypothetical protein